MKDTIFLAVTLVFVMSMLPVNSITTTSVFNAAASSSSSSSPPAHAAKVHFDTDTTITDIVAVHNSGIPFDKYVAKISAAAKGQNATISQIRAWNYIESLVKINSDVCNLNQQLRVNTKDPGNIIISSFVLPPPPKTICDSKMSFAYEICQGDPTIPDCNTSTASKHPSEAINQYIKTKNLHDDTQTDNLAYEELENVSVTLNHTPSNNIASVVRFGNSDTSITRS